jgi:small subunit ribosomal protein S3
MIERDIMAQKMKEFQIQEYIGSTLKKSGYSHTKLQRTPVGEKIVVYASRPGLVVGRQGSNIRKMTIDLKERFGLENPQIEVGEVENIYLDPAIVGEMIAVSLERFGSERFKGIMHKTMANVMEAGALGIEIVLSGKIPSARARSWRVYEGYLKKCGDVSVSGVRVNHAVANLKSGIVGIKVSIMPPDIILPDNVKIMTEEEEVEAAGKKAEHEKVVEAKVEAAEEKKEAKEKKSRSKKAAERRAEAAKSAEKAAVKPAEKAEAKPEGVPEEKKARKPRQKKAPEAEAQ